MADADRVIRVIVSKRGNEFAAEVFLKDRCNREFVGDDRRWLLESVRLQLEELLDSLEHETR